MCCQAKWKREAIPEHKVSLASASHVTQMTDPRVVFQFDFIDTAEFHTDDWFTRFR